MKLFLTTLAVVTTLVAGCASSSDLEFKLRQDLLAEIRNRTAELNDNLKKEIKDTESGIRRDMKESQNSLRSELTEIKEAQRKSSAETEKTLLDHQRQIFQNKSFVEDTARRVYMLESVVTSKTLLAPQQIKEGYVVYIDGKKAAISLGSINGVKVGDRFTIFNGMENIGTVEIDVVERDSCEGRVIQNSKTISVGDKIEFEKK